jgi:hypothetical protein
MTAGFGQAIGRVAADLVERWQNLGDGGVVEVKAEMSRVALEALVGCIFSEGLGDPKAVCDATTRYYATCGGLDPFDILGFPDFVPRLTRLRVRHVLRDFYEALSTAIAERRRSLAAEPNAARHARRHACRQGPANRRANDRSGSAGQCHNVHLRRTGDDVECIDVGDLFALAIS